MERILEKNNPLSSRGSAQSPTFSHLSFSKEECQHSKINTEGVWSIRNGSQSGDGVLHPKSCDREASSFKFTVSRLPKWAQAKVTSCNNVCKNLNCTSSEVSIFWIVSFSFWETPLYLSHLLTYSLEDSEDCVCIYQNLYGIWRSIL